MKEGNRSDFFGLLLVFAGVLLIVCSVAEWFDRETLQWLWILLLYFWIGYMSGEVGALNRRISWGFETGFVGSDSLNTRQLAIRAMKGGGGISIENDGGVRIAIENQGERLLLLIQDDQGKQAVAIDVRQLATLASSLLEQTPAEMVRVERREVAS
jgi:hypothetical protein